MMASQMQEILWELTMEKSFLTLIIGTMCQIGVLTIMLKYLDGE
jgi:hypothetical protein